MLSTSGAGAKDGNTLAHALLKTTAELLERDTYSDITLVVDERRIPAHKFVLASRGHWTSASLASTTEIVIDSTPLPALRTVLAWLYTEAFDDGGMDVQALLALVRAAATFRLPELMARWC